MKLPHNFNQIEAILNANIDPEYKPVMVQKLYPQDKKQAAESEEHQKASEYSSKLPPFAMISSRRLAAA